MSNPAVITSGMDVDKPQSDVPAEDPSTKDVDNKPPGDVTTETRVNEVKRILKCTPDDWHSILDVKQDCSALIARRAAIKSLLLIKDRFETGPGDIKTKANQATQLITDAADNLKAGHSYVEVDKDGQKATPPPESQPFSPISTVKEIYKQATASVLVFFSGVHATGHAELEILQYNENIRDIVQKENKEATILQQISGFIDLKTIKSYVSLRMEHEALEARDIKKLSRSEKVKTVAATKVLGQMGPVIDEFNTRKGYPSSWNWDRENHPKLWVTKPSDTTDQQTDYPAGQTKDGHNILGYLPVYKLNHQNIQYLQKCRFAIELDEEESKGCMKIATWAEVGQAAGQAYLDQPSTEKRFIPYSEARYSTPLQRAQFKCLLGFYAEYSPSESRWGPAYCWIELQGGDKDDDEDVFHDVVSKGCFEKIVGGKNPAITQIYQLFDNDPLNYSWRIQPTEFGSKYMREGPYGSVAIQKRKMIDNGPQVNQQTVAEKVDLAAILERLQADSATNKAQMESQMEYMSNMFKMLSARLVRVEGT